MIPTSIRLIISGGKYERSCKFNTDQDVDGSRSESVLWYFCKHIEHDKKEGTPGEIINIYKDGIGVKTNDGEIVLKEIKPEFERIVKNILSSQAAENFFNEHYKSKYKNLKYHFTRDNVQDKISFNRFPKLYIDFFNILNNPRKIPYF